MLPPKTASRAPVHGAESSCRQISQSRLGRCACVLRSAQRPPSVAPARQAPQRRCGTPQSRACQASCSVVHGSLDVDFECEEPKQWLRLQLDWFSLRVLATSAPIPQQDLSRRAPRPTDGLPAPANTRSPTALRRRSCTWSRLQPRLRILSSATPRSSSRWRTSQVRIPPRAVHPP